jgi:hypothetical protein
MNARIAVAVATAALAFPASAHAALLKGTVTGSPYLAGPTTAAVPVTFSKQSAQRAGLRSPVGVIVVPRRHAVPTPEGPVAPTALRLGDRFRFAAAVPAEARAAVYTRLATSRLSVYKRSRTLSNDELTTKLTALIGYVGQLQTGIAGALQRGDQQVVVLIGAIDALQRTLADTLKRLAATGVSGLPDAAAALGVVQQQLAALQQRAGTIAGGASPPAGGVAGAAGTVLGALPVPPLV